MKINVTHTAKLANLLLTDDEKSKFEKQLSDILTYVETLQKVDTEGIKATSQVTGLENTYREDVSTGKSSLPQSIVLSQAPAVHNQMFQVKGVLSDE